jgi:hypothetical protein
MVWQFSGETSQAAAMSEQNPVKAVPNLNIGMDIWSNSTMAAMPSGQVEVNAGTHLRRDKALSQMVCLSHKLGAYAGS